MKLSQRYYGSLKRLERIGEVAYKLKLPSSSLLHSVFYVSALKKMVGDPSAILEDLQTFDDEGEIILKPEAPRY